MPAPCRKLSTRSLHALACAFSTRTSYGGIDIGDADIRTTPFCGQLLPKFLLASFHNALHQGVFDALELFTCGRFPVRCHVIAPSRYIFLTLVLMRLFA
jgi:hypothetical protein